MKTCFFIGHRDAPESIYDRLLISVERHIVEYGVTDFVVGQYGSFDRLSTRALIQVKQRHPEVKLTLLLAYYYPLKPFELPQDYDGSLYPEGMERVPRRAAIIRANQYMIRHSDYLIAYDSGKIGNTRKLMNYAQRREDKGLICVENLYDQMKGFAR